MQDDYKKIPHSKCYEIRTTYQNDVKFELNMLKEERNNMA